MTDSVGIIGAGRLGQAMARTALRAGRRVVMANSRGPGSLTPVVTALGETLDGFWSGLCEGRSGIGPLTLFDTSEFKVHFGGQVPDWDPAARFGTKEARHLDRFAQFAMAASMAS